MRDIWYTVTEPDLAPTRGHIDDAGIDLRAALDGTISSKGWLQIPTGVSMALPDAVEGKIEMRSSLALTNGLAILGGVVDPGYVGEIKVIIINHGSVPFRFKRGQRIAQLVPHLIEAGPLRLVEKLPQTPRSDRGFGSTGRE